MHALALAAALASAAGVGFVSFLVLYAVDSGIGEGSAGLLLGAVSGAATASRIGLGALLDRRRQEPLMPVVAMLGLSVAGYLLLIPGEPAVIVVGALLAGSLGWAWPGRSRWRSCSGRPGAGLGGRRDDVGPLRRGRDRPLVVGLLAEHDHFSAAWCVCSAFALLSAGTIVATRRSVAPVDLPVVRAGGSSLLHRYGCTTDRTPRRRPRPPSQRYARGIAPAASRRSSASTPTCVARSGRPASLSASQTRSASGGLAEDRDPVVALAQHLGRQVAGRRQEVRRARAREVDARAVGHQVRQVGDPGARPAGRDLGGHRPVGAGHLHAVADHEARPRVLGAGVQRGAARPAHEGVRGGRGATPSLKRISSR